MDRETQDLIEIIQFTEQVAARIHGVLDEAAIYRIVGEEFAKLQRYTASIVLLADDEAKLRVAAISAPLTKLKAGEKAVGLRLDEYKIDLDKSSSYRRVIREGKTVQVKVSDVINELFPRPMAALVSKMMGYEKKSSILTPLHRRGKIIGALAMSSTRLAEYFVPSVKSLAQHISAALDLAEGHARRERTEEELRESEGRLRGIFESAQDAILTKDAEGRYTHVNTAFASLFGLKPDEVRGKTAFDLFPPEMARFIEETDRAVREKGEPVLVEDTELIADMMRTFDVSKVPLRDASGRVVEICGIVRDITDRKRAEDELKQYREQLEEMVQERTAELRVTNEQLQKQFAERKQVERKLQESEETARVLLNDPTHSATLIDENGVIIDLNETTARRFGRRRDELIGSQIWELFTPEAVEHRKAYVAEVVRSGEPVRFEDEREGIWNDNVLHPVIDAHGRVAKIALVAHDITGHKQMEEELTKHRDHLEQMIEERTQELKAAEQELIQKEKLAVVGRLAGRVAHELRNPLGVINNSAYYLESQLKGMDGKLREHLDLIRDEIQRSDEIIKGLLDFSGDRPPALETGDVNAILKGVLCDCKFPKEIAVETLLDENLPQIYLDPVQMKQVFVNIVSNAVQGMSTGGNLEIRTSVTDRRIEVAFRDTGAGIASENLEKIFEPFFTTKVNGIGLGLTISREIIAEHNGMIEVESELGKGTVVTVKLPLQNERNNA